MIDTLRWPAAALMLFGLTIGAASAGNPIVRVGGTGAGTLLAQSVFASFAQSRPTTVTTAVLPPLGTSGALRALASDVIQVAVVSRLPRSEESSAISEVIPWLTSPFVLAGRDVAAGTQFSRQQIADIYSLQLTKWPDGTPIRLVFRGESETDTRLLHTLSPEIGDAVLRSLKRPGIVVAESDLENQKMLERTPGSLGTVALGQLLQSGSPLKLVAVDGVKPSLATLQSRAYPYQKRFYLVVGKSPTAATRDFVAYLQSGPVIEFLRGNGYLPLSP